MTQQNSTINHAKEIEVSNLTSGENRQFVQAGALSALGMALCYVALFVIYGAILPASSNVNVTDKINSISENRMLFKWTYLIGYVLFSGFLCICIQVTHRLYASHSSLIINTASLFGIFWAVVLLSTAMIGLTHLELMHTSLQEDPSTTEILFHSASLLEESLGGGIELLGGVWVMLLGLGGLRYKLFSRAFSWFSILKGVVGICTLVLSDSILRELFGITGIVWFVWLGTILWKTNERIA